MISKRVNERAGAGVTSGLARVGALTAAVYLLTCLFYLRGPQSHTRTARELFAWFFVLTLLPLFWKGYKIVEQTADAALVRTIVWFAAAFCLLAFLTFPFHSTDVFGYINRGWQQVHYGQNPYVYSVSEIPQWQQDQMIWNHWIYNPDPYGFLFTFLCRVLAQIGNGHWWLTLLLFKGVNLLAYALTGWLVWHGAKRLGHEKPVVALYLFLWNPLILMHHIANGHNDILIGCMIALAMYLAITGAALWIIPVLVAATFLKYAPALLIPFAFIFVVKNRGWKTAALSCLLGALVFVLACVPYAQDWRQFKLLDIQTNATLIDNSLHSFIIHIFENIARLLPFLNPLHMAVDSAIKMTLRLGFIIFLLVQLFKAFKDSSARRLIYRSSLVMFVLICVVSSKFNAWYLGMLLPSVLLLDAKDWLRRVVVLISSAQLLSLTFFKQAYMLNFFAMILIPAWIVFRQVSREKEKVKR